MYKAFFHLSRSPFDLTPDPSCFVPTRSHNDVLAALYHGVRGNNGFVVVTGEVGTGKTLLLRCLLRRLKDIPNVAYAYMFNGRLSPTEFLQYILADFGLPAGGKNKIELLRDLRQLLISRGSKGLTTVLIIDEAHHLSEDILEEIRLLSNLETVDGKLLNIVLAGQPELDEKLDTVGLRQLKQRIGVRAQLAALDASETGEYIQKRLQIAGGYLSGDPLFPAETLAAVYRHSKGLPRLINAVCENALIVAYARQVHTVSPDVVDDVAREFRLNGCTRNSHRSDERGDSDIEMATNVQPMHVGALFTTLGPSIPLPRATYPGSMRMCGMAFGAGLALGMLTVFLQELLDQRRYNDPEIKKLMPDAAISETYGRLSCSGKRRSEGKWVLPSAALAIIVILAGSAFSLSAFLGYSRDV